MESKDSKQDKGSEKRTKAEKALDYVMQHPGRVLVGGIVIGIGSHFLYKAVRNVIMKARQGHTAKKIGDSPAVRQATMLRNAMNPSGYSWLMNLDQTNEAKIYDTAKGITDMNEVISAYKNLYDSDLLEDLQSELDTEEYQKFMTLISSNPDKTGKPAVPFVKKSQMVVAKKEVYVRKTPDASYHGAWYESASGNNIIFQAKAGEFLGYATGKQELDTDNNVKFIQVGYLVKKENLPLALKAYAGKTYSMWVSSSKDYVDIFDDEKTMLSQYPQVRRVLAYKKPLDYYDKTVKGIQEKMVVSISDTRVLDENMQFYCEVEKQVLLGRYLGNLQTGGKKYIQFLTVDNTERWAESTTTKIIEQ